MIVIACLASVGKQFPETLDFLAIVAPKAREIVFGYQQRDGR